MSKVSVTVLGAAREVGRSCIMVEYNKIKIMLDCGLHPGLEGYNALPFFDLVDMSDLDAIFISHYHGDHTLALPYFYRQLEHQPPIYMTKPTLLETRKILHTHVKTKKDKKLYSEQDIKFTLDHVICVDFHQTLSVTLSEERQLSFTSLPAGHVLGAAMFMLDLFDQRVLYTGDYCLRSTRMLAEPQVADFKGKKLTLTSEGSAFALRQVQTSFKSKRVHTLIMESTHGDQNHHQEDQIQRSLEDIVNKALLNKGRVLFPVMAFGHTEELLLHLFQWQDKLHGATVPIYIQRSIVDQLIEMMESFSYLFNNDKLLSSFVHRLSDKEAKYPSVVLVDHLADLPKNDTVILLASSGILQSGMSREAFGRWCVVPENWDLLSSEAKSTVLEQGRNTTVVITGMTPELTLAHQLMTSPKTVLMNGQQRKLMAAVENVSLSAHADAKEATQLVQAVDPQNVILVHGNFAQMKRLCTYWNNKEAVKVPVYTPKLGEELVLDGQSSSQETTSAALVPKPTASVQDTIVLEPQHANFELHHALIDEVYGALLDFGQKRVKVVKPLASIQITCRDGSLQCRLSTKNRHTFLSVVQQGNGPDVEVCMDNLSLMVEQLNKEDVCCGH